MDLGQMFNQDTMTIIIVGVVVVALAIGLLKKTLWLCIVAIILAGGLMITQPNNLDAIKDSVSSFFDGAIDPFKTEDEIHDAGDEAIGDIEREDEYSGD